ncbi:MAG: transcriptional regulator [Candidatus Parabeggiatoa sp. nov. 1]|nr:MAG: transcriptional regulator [Gammaproteobacteria bacterium]
MDKSIPKVVHETAKGLNKADLMDTKTLRESDTQRVLPVKGYNPEQIKQIRVKNQVSQAIFAVYLNTSPSTVWRWENGKIKPKGTSLKLLNLVERKGLDILS